MKIIDTVRLIRHNAIPRLDDTSVSSGGTGTDHTHANKAFLDELNINNERTLTYESQPTSIPLLQEDW